MYEIENKKDCINVLAISDLHLCNIKDRIDLVYKAYEYADKKKIKYILNLGDIIDGVMPHNKEEIKISNINDQIKYVIDNYPYSSKIKTLALYGNHDYYSLYKENIDVAKIIYSERKDIYNLGYGENYIKIDNNYIKLSHEIDLLKGYKKNMETFINILGHLHNFKVGIYDDIMYIHVPSLSDLRPDGNNNIPAILDINFKLYRDIISNVEIEYIDIEKESTMGSFELAYGISNKKYIRIKEKFNDFKL